MQLTFRVLVGSTHPTSSMGDAPIDPGSRPLSTLAEVCGCGGEAVAGGDGVGCLMSRTIPCRTS